MTKLTKKQLIEEYVSKARDTHGKSKELLFQLVREARAEYTEIDKDTRLSPEGKAIEREAARQHYNEMFLRHAADLKSEYKRHVGHAKKVAQEVLATPPANPMNEAQNVAFEASLADLKTRVLLHPKGDQAAKMVTDFVKANNDEYKSHVIAQQFHSIIAPVIGSVGTEQKATLMQAYETAQKATLNEEKVYAQQALGIAEEPRFYLTQYDSLHFQSLREVIGRRGAEMANEPEQELARLQSGAPEQTEQNETTEPRRSHAPAITTQSIKPINA